MILNQLIRDTQKALNQYAVHSICQLEYLLSVLTSEEISRDNPFEFNDMDNHAWMEDSSTIIFDCQNYTFIAKKCMDESWQVYSIDSNSETASVLLSQLLENIQRDDEIHYDNYSQFIISFKKMNAMDVMEEFIDVTLEKMALYEKSDKNTQIAVQEFSGDLSKVNYMLFYLGRTAQALGWEYGGMPQYPADIAQHDYQLKYSHVLYGKTKNEFYHYVFMILGSGYDWDSKGNLISSEVIYRTDIDKLDINSIDKGELNYIYPAYDNEYNNLLHYPSNITPQWSLARMEFIMELNKLVRDFPNLSLADQNRLLGDSKLEDLMQFTEKCHS